jgi:hypothetical protein
VVDLDRSTFEVFEDYAKKKHAGSRRFADVGDPEDTVLRFVRSFDFSNLPTPEEFVKLFGDAKGGLDCWKQKRKMTESLLEAEEEDAER